MHAVIKNNDIVQQIQPFTRLIVDGNDYGSNWSVNMTAQELAAIGVVEIVEQPEADQRFYWTGSSVELLDGVPTRVQTATPKELEQLKTDWTSQVKATANTMLAQTDWAVVRKMDIGTDVPAEIATQRTAVRTECDRLTAAIAAAADLDALIAVVTAQNWSAE